MKSSASTPGVVLSNGSSIITGAGINSKTVFSDLGFPVTMHELWPGSAAASASASASTAASTATSTSTSTSEHKTDNPLAFAGQLGLIDFSTTVRLPRHVHIFEDRFIHERILVLQGVALVEMNGEIYVIPPRSLVTIAPGVPHTWTACPAGVPVPVSVSGSGSGSGGDGDGDGNKVTTSDGTFLMVYEYEEPTSFRPTRQTHTLGSVGEYVACPTEELDAIRFPVLDAAEVRKRCWFVDGLEVRREQ